MPLEPSRIVDSGELSPLLRRRGPDPSDASSRAGAPDPHVPITRQVILGVDIVKQALFDQVIDTYQCRSFILELMTL